MDHIGLIDKYIFSDQTICFCERQADVAAVGDVRKAAALLAHPLRPRIVALAREPASATELATRLRLPRQRVNYHVRQLARTGFLRRAGQIRKRNLIEQRYVATARAVCAGAGDPRATRDDRAPRRGRVQRRAPRRHLPRHLQSDVSHALTESTARGSTPCDPVDCGRYSIRERGATRRFHRDASASRRRPHRPAHVASHRCLPASPHRAGRSSSSSVATRRGNRVVGPIASVETCHDTAKKPEHRGRIIRSTIRTMATPEQIFEAWADPAKLAQWFPDRAEGRADRGWRPEVVLRPVQLRPSV